MQALGAGLMVVVTREANAQPAPPATRTLTPATTQAAGPRGGGRGGPAPINISARIHIGQDDVVTVMTGKVECGQGARALITAAVAEELGVPADQVTLVMGDTDLCPNDGVTDGSQTTPRMIPTIRQAAAAAREALIALAASKWGVAENNLDASEGKVRGGGVNISYGELVGDASSTVFATPPAGNISVTLVKDWKVMGTPVLRNDRDELVTGRHQYPSDITRPGMVYGKILRPPSYGAKLTALDLTAATKLKGVEAFRDGDFVGVAAPTVFAAGAALEALSATAKWDENSTLSSTTLYADLLKTAQGGATTNPYAADVAAAARSLKAEYHVAYIAHAPLEPRSVVAEWAGGRMTVWAGTRAPFDMRRAVAGALGIGQDAVRVIVPDFGGGFGGKTAGDADVEAARLSRGIGTPVCLRWTREEEFTWAYFRPAGVYLAEAALDAQGKISSWFYTCINSDGTGTNTPYTIAGGKKRERSVGAKAPLKEGAYRNVGSTGNHFVRESFMDELATAAGIDPLTFRLNHLDNARLKAALQQAATSFGFAEKWKNRQPDIGVGISCGTERGGVVGCCVEVAIDRPTGKITIRKLTQTFECGAIVNPHGLLSQVTGGIVMGMGGALREEIRFEKGKIVNGSFGDYPVPRFADMPVMDVQLMNRPDLPSAGAGECPILGVAPAVANAVFHATGVRIRQMPVKLPAQA